MPVSLPILKLLYGPEVLYNGMELLPFRHTMITSAFSAITQKTNQSHIGLNKFKILGNTYYKEEDSIQGSLLLNLWIPTQFQWKSDQKHGLLAVAELRY